MISVQAVYKKKSNIVVKTLRKTLGFGIFYLHCITFYSLSFWCTLSPYDSFCLRKEKLSCSELIKQNLWFIQNTA